MRAGPVAKSALESRMESWCIVSDSPDEDQSFEAARANCCALEDLAANLESQFKNEVVRLTLYAQATQSTATLFKAFYDESLNQDRMTPVCLNLEANQSRFTTTNIHKVANAIDNGLVAPLIKFRGTLVAAKDEVKARCDAQKQYLHYKVKLAELRAEQERLLAKGKQVPAKEAERLVRNEGKFERAKAVYEALNTRVVALLEYLYSTRFIHLDPVFQSYVDLQFQLHQRLTNEAQQVRSTLQAALQKPLREPLNPDTLPAYPNFEDGVSLPEGESKHGGNGHGHHQLDEETGLGGLGQRGAPAVAATRRANGVADANAEAGLGTFKDVANKQRQAQLV